MVIVGGHEAFINPDYGARYQVRRVTFEYGALYALGFPALRIYRVPLNCLNGIQRTSQNKTCTLLLA